MGRECDPLLMVFERRLKELECSSRDSCGGSECLADDTGSGEGYVRVTVGSHGMYGGGCDGIGMCKYVVAVESCS